MTSIPPEGPLWKTRQVAEALGLSPSTVKRLVDAGRIRAARTSGGHRLIPAAEAFRYATEQDLPTARLERLLGPAPRGTRPEADASVTPEALVAALRRGRTEEARRLVTEHFGAVGAVGLADRLVRSALYEIGHEWRAGTLDVFQEHRATRTLESALMELVDRVGPRPGRLPSPPLAIGCGPEGDPYTIAGLLCELALRESGWEVMNLGPNLPMASLAKAVLAHQPRLVWITVSHLNDPGRFAREYANFYAAASKTGAAVILGGQALGPDLRGELAAAGFGERVGHLVELARRLHPSSPRPGSGRQDQDGPAGGLEPTL